MSPSELNDEMVHVGGYGVMPIHLRRMVGRFGITTSDWQLLTVRFGTDWAGVRAFILKHVHPPREFLFPADG